MSKQMYVVKMGYTELAFTSLDIATSLIRATEQAVKVTSDWSGKYVTHIEEKPDVSVTMSREEVFTFAEYAEMVKPKVELEAPPEEVLCDLDNDDEA